MHELRISASKSETRRGLHQGKAWSIRSLGDPAQNIENEIDQLQMRLTSRSEQIYPYLKAESQDSLETAWLGRIEGDKENNLEKAIRCYEQANITRAREAMPIEWATTTWLERIEESKKANLEKAIECYLEAVRARDAMPIKWASITTNLGSGWANRIERNRKDNLEKAIECLLLYKEALTVTTRDAMPAEQATTTMSIRNAWTSPATTALEQEARFCLQEPVMQLAHGTPASLPLPKVIKF